MCYYYLEFEISLSFFLLGKIMKKIELEKLALYCALKIVF